MAKQTRKLHLPVNRERCRKNFRVLSLLLIFLSTVNTYADDYLEMDLEELLQVTVKGSTLRDESLKTVPSSVTVFTREQLDTLGLDYLHELMNLVPGFQATRIADSSINYTFSARGRRQGARAREILLLVDGRVFADPRSGGADSGITLYPLANIERIEIIRGPGSAIYGSGAYTGVINIVSRRNQKRILAAAGSDNRRKADVNFSQTAGDWQFDLYAHAYKDKGQDYHLASGANTSDPRQEALVDLELSYKNTRLQFFNSHLEGEEFYTLEKIDNDFNRNSQILRHVRLEQGLKPADDWDTTLSLNYYKVEQELEAPFLFPGPALAPGTESMLAKVLLAGEAWRADLANDITISDASSVQLGIEWRNERETDAKAKTNYDLEQLVQRDFPITYYGNFNNTFLVGAEDSRDVIGAYGQWLYNLTDTTRLTLGARYDHYESVDEHISPRVGLVHQLNEIHTIKLLYGEAFRAPSFAETSLLNNPVLVGNPELDYETVNTWELMWMATWTNISVASTIFHNRYENPIATGLVENTRTYVNSADESQYGGGVRMDWQVSPRWLLRLNYAHMAELPDSAFREAENLAIAMLNFHQGKWSWNISANYQGERNYLLTQTQQATIDSHWVASSKLRYQFHKTTNISLAIKNIFDEDYASPAQGAGIVGGVPNRGREWLMGVEWFY